MPRRDRKDYPGAWWHVINRGAGRCTLFHDEEEGRYFLSLLARAVRWVWIEIHADCLMPNHFHLLIRSPAGELARAMHWVEYGYALWLNRRHGRTGALFQGRYRAKRIHNLRYRRGAFVYIHENPQAAGLDAFSDVYWESSAHHHETGRGRPWLSREFGRTVVPRRDAIPRELLERWFAHPTPDLRETDAMLQGSPAVVRRWLRREAARPAKLAPRSLVLPATLRSVLRQARRGGEEPVVRLSQRRRPAWDLLAAGLLHTACGLPADAVAQQSSLTPLTVRRRLVTHAQALVEDDGYLTLVARVLLDCLRRDYGGGRR